MELEAGVLGTIHWRLGSWNQWIARKARTEIDQPLPGQGSNSMSK